MPESRFKKGRHVERLSDYFDYIPEIAGKMIACYFKKRGTMIVKLKHRQKGVTGRAFMARGSRGRIKFAGWHNGNSRAVYFTKEMAIKENEKRRRRINARFGFSQLIPLKAVDALKVVAAKYGFNIGNIRVKGNKPNRKWQGEDAIVKVSMDKNRIDLSLVSAYTFKNSKTMFGKSQDKNAEFYNNAIERALPKALSNTINDIQTYMQKKMRERAMRLNK
jgi:hypothetical protein